MTWDNVHEQRDNDGNFTPLALAVQTLQDNGCDCGEGPDDPPCMGHLCEAALRTMFEKVERLEQECIDHEDEQVRWKEATGLECGGDPDGVEPKHLAADITKRERCEATLRDRLRSGYLEVLPPETTDDGPDVDAYVDGQVEDLHVIIARTLATRPEHPPHLKAMSMAAKAMTMAGVSAKVLGRGHQPTGGTGQDFIPPESGGGAAPEVDAATEIHRHLHHRRVTELEAVLHRVLGLIEEGPAHEKLTQAQVECMEVLGLAGTPEVADAIADPTPFVLPGEDPDAPACNLHPEWCNGDCGARNPRTDAAACDEHPATCDACDHFDLVPHGKGDPDHWEGVDEVCRYGDGEPVPLTHGASTGISPDCKNPHPATTDDDAVKVAGDGTGEALQAISDCDEVKVGCLDEFMGLPHNEITEVLEACPEATPARCEVCPDVGERNGGDSSTETIQHCDGKDGKHLEEDEVFNGPPPGWCPRRPVTKPCPQCEATMVHSYKRERWECTGCDRMETGRRP